MSDEERLHRIKQYCRGADGNDSVSMDTAQFLLARLDEAEGKLAVREKSVAVDFDHFWRDLVLTDGKMDEEKVKNELYDYLNFMGEVAQVYMEITGGRLSKPNYEAHAVIDVWKGVREEETAEVIKEATEELRDKLDAAEEKAQALDWWEQHYELDVYFNNRRKRWEVKQRQGSLLCFGPTLLDAIRAVKGTA